MNYLAKVALDTGTEPWVFILIGVILALFMAGGGLAYSWIVIRGRKSYDVTKGP